MDNGSGKCKIFLFLAMTFHIYVNWFITDPTFPTFNMGNHSNWWADIPFTKVNYVWFYNDRNKNFSMYWLALIYGKFIYFIKRWSEVKSFTIFENHVCTSKKILHLP